MSDNILNQETIESNSTESVAEQQSSEAVVNQAATNIEFVNTISEDLRAQGNLKDFKDVDQLAKSYIELQRMVGNSVRIPSEDASDEAKTDFLSKIKDVDGVLLKNDEALLNKLGKPETVNDYDFAEIVNPDVVGSVPAFNDELNHFKNIAHEAGLTNEQAQKLVEMRISSIEAQHSQIEAQRTEAEAELKKLWGSDYDNRLNGAKQVAKIYHEKYGDSMAELINSSAGNNPALLSILSELSVVYKEKKHEGLSGNTFGMTPDMAMAKISEKRADSGFLKAYNDGMHPGHKKAVAEMAKLYSIANGIETS